MLGLRGLLVVITLGLTLNLFAMRSINGFNFPQIIDSIIGILKSFSMFVCQVVIAPLRINFKTTLPMHVNRIVYMCKGDHVSRPMLVE